MSEYGDQRRTGDDTPVPNEEEVSREFPHGDGRPLQEQTSLVDEDGDDIRRYTGEPVQTDDGWVTPQQSPTGSRNVVGGGEFPNTPGRADRDADRREAAPRATPTEEGQ